MKGMMFILGIVLLCSIVYADTSSGKISESVNIDLVLLNQNPDPGQPGRYVELRFRTDNLGTLSAEDVIFELVPQYPFSLDPGDSPTRKIGTIYGRATGDESATLYYKLRVDKNAIEGNNQIRLKYSIDGGSNWVLADEFDVRIQTIDASVGITSVKSTPTKIEPGKNADVRVTLVNLADSLLNDISLKLVLGSDSMPFAPLNSSSEKRVKSLDSGESVDFVFKLITLADADSKVYKVPIEITYLDESDKLHNTSDIIALVVGSLPDMSITIDSQTLYSQGSSGEIEIKFVNKGLTDIKFLNVEIKPTESFDVFSTKTVYLGDLDSDDYETAEFKIFIKKAEQSVKIPLSLEYKDANNEEFRQNVELELRLYSKTEMKQFGMAEQSRSVGLFIMIAIVGVGYYFYRKRKK